MQKICSGCGGSLIREGNYLVCEYCHRKELIDVSDDLHAVARANAWEALRKSDFDKATELFEELVIKNPKDYDSNWGLALARASIVYVNDVIENRKVPTCNNVSENSFVEDKNVKNAILYAPKEIGESYKAHAEYIEKVRIEWLEKASKEPPYDVFISFKDSDREHGIERTSDSQTMQDLYTALVEKGYKVFYSRVSLRGKVSEQYEPYIYNALKTAKVMIVYGEKAEYFNATWIKNEWSRYKKRIEQGEKHKNSLVVVYKGVNPYDIPVALTGGRQAIDLGIISNYEVLLNHVKRVVDESKKVKSLDKIEIKGGQMGKKSSQIKQETLQTREIGSSSVETSITEKQQLNLVRTFIKMGDWGEASNMLDDLVFANPENAELKWKYLLVKHKIKGDEDLANKIHTFKEEDFKTVERILSISDKALATKILDLLYSCTKNTSDKYSLKILKIALPLNYENRKEKIGVAFNNAIKSSHFETFKTLLQTLESHEVDDYIKYTVAFADNTSNPDHKNWCLNKVLEVDEGNVGVLEVLYKNNLSAKELDKAKEGFERLLKYSKNVNDSVKNAILNLENILSTVEDCEFVNHAIRYYGGNLAEISPILSKVAEKMVGKGYFAPAKTLCEVIITANPIEPTPYWLLCLIALGVKTEQDVFTSYVELKSLPEYRKYLALVGESRQMDCIKLAKEQEKCISFRKQKEIERQRQLQEKEAKRKRKQEEEERQRLLAEKAEKKLNVVVSVILIICVVATTIFSVIGVVNTAKSNALQLTLSSDKSYYIVTGVEQSKETYEIPATYKGKPVKSIGDYAFEDGSLTSIEIPDSVTLIGDSAFSGCSSLTNIVIPDSVTLIGAGAFSGCSSLTSIEIPDSVASIGAGAFSGCSSLTSIVIPDSVASIGGNAFDGCSSLSSIVIPDSVISIGEYAFYGCTSLTSIIIPDSVTSIGDSVFNGCSRLTTIKFTGTKSQWKNIQKGIVWNDEVPATVVVCSDGTVAI